MRKTVALSASFCAATRTRGAHKPCSVGELSAQIAGLAWPYPKGGNQPPKLVAAANNVRSSGPENPRCWLLGARSTARRKRWCSRDAPSLLLLLGVANGVLALLLGPFHGRFGPFGVQQARRCRGQGARAMDQSAPVSPSKPCLRGKGGGSAAGRNQVCLLGRKWPPAAPTVAALAPAG